MKLSSLFALSGLLVLCGAATSQAVPVSDTFTVTVTGQQAPAFTVTVLEDQEGMVLGPFFALVSAGQGATGTTAIFLLEPCCANQISDILFAGSPPAAGEDPFPGAGTNFFFVSDPFLVAAAIDFVNNQAGPGKNLFGPVNCTPPGAPAPPKPACPSVIEKSGGNDLSDLFAGGTVVVVSDVPLPRTLLLLLSGFAAISGLRRMRGVRE